MAWESKYIVRSLLSDSRRSRGSQGAQRACGMRSLQGKRGTRSTRGESLTEVLVAVAIGGLALIMLAMAISTASSMAAQSRAFMNDYYEANNAANANDATSIGTGPVTLTSTGEGSAVSVPLVNTGESLRVTYSENAEAGASGVVIYDSVGGGA